MGPAEHNRREINSKMSNDVLRLLVKFRGSLYCVYLARSAGFVE